MLISLSLFGCKKEEAKVYPKDRLTVEYSIDRDTILLGDPVELTVRSLYPTNGVLQLPELDRGKEIVLLKRDGEAVSREDGLAESVAHYKITSFRLGDFAVSTNSIACTVGEQTFSTNFPSITLHVKSALPENASDELAGIKPVRKLPGRIPQWIWIVLGAALCAFGVGLMTSRLLKERKKPKPQAPPRPPHEIAFEALQALRNKGLLEQDECNPFYTELSRILRTYLEGRFHLNAPDETTEEIIEEISRSSELNGTQRNILQEFMRQADMVKFAKGRPERSSMESAFDTTKRFVEETKWVAEAVPENQKSEGGGVV